MGHHHNSLAILLWDETNDIYLAYYLKLHLNIIYVKYNVHFKHVFSAFSQCGFNVSPAFVQMVIVKFDIMAKRSLTLDNFIQACVMLRSLTDTFRQKDTNQTGSINVSYEDFMVMAITNKP